MRCSHTCKPRAITLIELVISMAIATVLGLLVVGLMRLISRASRETTSSYLISRDGEETIRILREDLRQTALSSVRVYSGETRQVPPSLTCASAQAPGQPIALNEDGQPRWTGSLSYRLETAANGQSASLIRTFTPYTPEQGFLPQVAPVPVPGPAAGQARVLLTNLAPPNAELPPTAAGEARRLGPSGGFQAVFLHRDPQTD